MLDPKQRGLRKMKVSTCSYRPALNKCTLKDLDYQVDTYIGCEHYCYYCYVLSQAETDWTKEILIHKDITDRLNNELSKIPPQTIYMGWHTDPYQPCEAEYRQTRQVLELLLEKGFSASILTKSDLILRDIDVLEKMDNASVSVSVAFNDERTRELFEARTMATGARIEALKKMKEIGIRTTALICPVIPYITDAKSLIDLLAPYTEVIWIYGLSILEPSGRNWRNIQAILNRHFPSLQDKIESAVLSKDDSYWDRLRHDLEKVQKERQLNLNIHV